MPSVLDQDRIPTSKRVACAALGLVMLVSVFCGGLEEWGSKARLLVACIGVSALVTAAMGRYGNVEVLRQKKCPQCGKWMEVYQKVTSREHHPGLLSSTSVLRKTAFVKCTNCPYESTLQQHAEEQQRQGLRQRRVEASIPSTGTEGDPEVELTQQAAEQALEQDLARERLRAKIGNKNKGQHETHPDKARLEHEFGCTCPSCRRESALLFRRWIRRHAPFLSAPITLESQSYVKCRHCDYLVTLAAFKKENKKEISNSAVVDNEHVEEARGLLDPVASG